MASVMFRNQKAANKVDIIPQLLSSDCMRDAKLICKNGTVWWSALLISQWSDLARTKMTELGHVVSPDFPLALILPDVDLTIVEKLLSWTLNGTTSLTSQEALEMKSILGAMAANMEVLQEPPTVESRSGSSSSQRMSESSHTSSSSTSKRSSESSGISSSCKARTGPGASEAPLKANAAVNNKHKLIGKMLWENDDCGNSVSGTEDVQNANPGQIDMDSLDISTSHVDATLHTGNNSTQSEEETSRTDENAYDEAATIEAWACPVCPMEFQTGENLVDHMCYAHFSQMLLQVWGETREPYDPCPVCRKVLFSKPASSEEPTVLREYEKQISIHIGKEHEYILRLTNKDVSRTLLQSKFFGQPLTDEDLSVEELMTFEDCQICTSSLRSRKARKLHLAQVHFSGLLLQNFRNEGVGTECKICQEEIDPSNGGQIYNAISHMLDFHGEETEKVLRKTGQIESSLHQLAIGERADENAMPQDDRDSSLLDPKYLRFLKDHSEPVRKPISNGDEVDRDTLNDVMDAEEVVADTGAQDGSKSEEHFKGKRPNLSSHHDGSIEIKRSKLVESPVLKSVKHYPDQQSCGGSEGPSDFQPNIGKVKEESDKPTCPLCFSQHNTNNAMAYHVCQVHFGARLQEIWGDRKVSAPCPVCHKVLWQGSKVDRRQIRMCKRRILMHLGKTHRYIQVLASPKEKEALVEANVFSSKKVTTSKKHAYFGYKDCHVCEDLSSDEKSLKQHLAHVHYREFLLANFSDNNLELVCLVCHEPVCSENGGQARNAISHILEEHGEIFEKKLRRSKSPEEFAKNSTKAEKQSTKLGKASKGQGSSKSTQKPLAKESNQDKPNKNKRCKTKLSKSPKDLHNQPSDKKASGDKATMICPVCNLSFKDAKYLKRHLCRTHYLLDMFLQNKVVDLDKCVRCGECKATPGQTESALRARMAFHLGLTHNALSDVVPDDVAEKLSKMGVVFGPKMSKENNVTSDSSSSNDDNNRGSGAKQTFENTELIDIIISEDGL